MSDYSFLVICIVTIVITSLRSETTATVSNSLTVNSLLQICCERVRFALGRAAKSGVGGEIASGPQGAKGLLTTNATRAGGLIK